MHMQVPVNSKNSDQGPVLGCLATDSVSAEGATDVSPFASKSCQSCAVYLELVITAHNNTQMCWKSL